MATLTVATIESRARELAGDTDTTNPGVSQAIVIELLNEVYQALWALFPRPVSRSDSVLWAAAFAQSTKSVLSTVTNVRNFLAVYREANDTGAAIGTPMEGPIPPFRIVALQASDPTEGTPTRCSVERVSTTTAADQGKWLIRLHPVPSVATFMSARVVEEAQVFTTTAQALDMDTEDAYGVAGVVASKIAALNRKPKDRIDEIWRTVPAKFKQIFDQPVPRQLPAGET